MLAATTVANEKLMKTAPVATGKRREGEEEEVIPTEVSVNAFLV
jgi:hypothetical protein